jgi:hypothetical protein
MVRLHSKFARAALGAAIMFVTTAAAPAFAQPDSTKKEREPFQARVVVTPVGTGFSSALLDIPAGKRLVIENVSAIARAPQGYRMEVNFFSYFDNNGDGAGDIADIVFHRIALIDQGTFGDTALAAANHKVLIFADEQIGTQHLKVVVQARLNAPLVGSPFVQAQVTLSGYLEDLPGQ